MIIIPDAAEARLTCDHQAMTVHVKDVNTETVSDGFHTFGELYDQRAHLLALATALSQMTTYRSRRHDDGTMFGGMFWVGTESPGRDDGPRPVTFHIGQKHWALFDHAVTLDKAPPFDGHTPADVMHSIDEWIAWLATWNMTRRDGKEIQ